MKKIAALLCCFVSLFILTTHSLLANPTNPITITLDDVGSFTGHQTINAPEYTKRHQYIIEKTVKDQWYKFEFSNASNNIYLYSNICQQYGDNEYWVKGCENNTYITISFPSSVINFDLSISKMTAPHRVTTKNYLPFFDAYEFAPQSLSNYYERVKYVKDGESTSIYAEARPYYTYTKVLLDGKQVRYSTSEDDINIDIDNIKKDHLVEFFGTLNPKEDFGFDVRDPQDDFPLGATTLVPNTTIQTLKCKIGRADQSDWYKFEAQVGKGYVFNINTTKNDEDAPDFMGDIYQEVDGKLEYITSVEEIFISEANGTYYLVLYHDYYSIVDDYELEYFTHDEEMFKVTMRYYPGSFSENPETFSFKDSYIEVVEYFSFNDYITPSYDVRSSYQRDKVLINGKEYDGDFDNIEITINRNTLIEFFAKPTFVDDFAVDAFDPIDNSPSGATHLNITNDYQSHDNHYIGRGDVSDWYKVDIIQGGRYCFYMKELFYNNSSGRLSSIYYLNSNGELEYYDEGDDIEIESPGTYYINTCSYNGDDNTSWYKYNFVYYKSSPLIKIPSDITIPANGNLTITVENVSNETIDLEVGGWDRYDNYKLAHKEKKNITFDFGVNPTTDTRSYHLSFDATSASGKNEYTSLYLEQESNIIEIPRVCDEWDPLDDAESGATLLSNPTTTLQTHGPHTLNGVYDWHFDEVDYFKINFEKDKIYQFKSDQSISIRNTEYMEDNGNSFFLFLSPNKFEYFRPQESGTYVFYVPRSNNEHISYTLSYGIATPPTLDQWDPVDDTSAGAIELRPSNTLKTHGKHVLYKYFDEEDWFKFTLSANQPINIYSTSENNDDMYAELYDSNMNLILVSDDLGDDLQFNINYMPSIAGTYYLKIRTYSTNAEYTLNYKLSQESFYTFTIIDGDNTKVFNYIEGDCVEYKFEDIEEDNPFVRWEITPKMIAWLDYSWLEFTMPPANVTARVIRENEYKADEWEPDNSPEEATELFISSECQAQGVHFLLDGRDSEDWFKFDLVAGQSVSIYSSSVNDDDVYSELYDSNMNLISESDDEKGMQFKFDFIPNTSGVYYLVVYSYSDTAEYSLHYGSSEKPTYRITMNGGIAEKTVACEGDEITLLYNLAENEWFERWKTTPYVYMDDKYSEETLMCMPNTDVVITPIIHIKPNGNGLENNPFIITSREELEYLRSFEFRDSYFILGNDIEMGTNPFEPIDYFEGTLNGNGYLIKNLKLKSSDANHLGLFSYTNGATIYNMGIKNVSFADADEYMGGLIGYAFNTTVNQCFVTIDSATQYYDVDNICFGAFIASSDSCVISNSYAIVNDLNFKDVAMASMFIGESKTSIINNVYSVAQKYTIQNSDSAAIVGSISNNNISHAYWDNNKFSGKAYSKENRPSTINNVLGKTTLDMQSQAYVDLLNIESGSELFVMDPTGNVNTRYPAFNWQKISKDPVKCIVIFEKNGGINGTDVIEVTTGDPMPTAIAPEKTGHNFIGYYDAIDKGIQYYNSAMQCIRTWDKYDSAILYARWTPSTYTVTLNQNGGNSPTETLNVIYGYAMPNTSITPERAGFAFTGYFDTPTSGGTQYYNANLTSTRNWDKAQNSTLFARWAKFNIEVAAMVEGKTDVKFIGDGFNEQAVNISINQIPVGNAPFNSGKYVWNTVGFNNGKTTITASAQLDNNLVSVTTSTIVNNKGDWKLHSEDILNDEIWNKQYVHVVSKLITVKSGATLLIEPGSIVKFFSGAGIIIESDATLVANGVTFTHIADDSVGGDTNCDGSNSKPTDNYQVTVKIGGTFTRDQDTIEKYKSLTLPSPIVTVVELMPNTTYVATANISVNAGGELIVPAGTVIKFAKQTGISVNNGGKITVKGTLAHPAIFTSINDDRYGASFLGENRNPTPALGDWKYIQVNTGGTFNANYANIYYGGYFSSSTAMGIVYLNGGVADIKNSIISQSIGEGIFSSWGSLDVENTLISHASTGIRGTGTIKHCIIADCETGFSGNIAYNSIIYNCKNAGWGQFDHCNFWKTPVAYNNNNGKNVDPMFRNPATGDYRIINGSPMIDAGNGDYSTDSDYYGNTRSNDQYAQKTGKVNAKGIYPDIGIYEFGGSSTPLFDIVVTDISIPQPTVYSDGDVIVTYVVQNTGLQAINGFINTKIMFNDQIPNDPKTGDVVATLPVFIDNLQVGESKTISASFEIQTYESSCTKFVGVYANFDDLIQEATNNNEKNAKYALNPISIVVNEQSSGDIADSEIILGSPRKLKYTHTLAAKNYERVMRFNLDRKWDGAALMFKNDFGSTYSQHPSPLKVKKVQCGPSWGDYACAYIKVPAGKKLYVKSSTIKYYTGSTFSVHHAPIEMSADYFLDKISPVGAPLGGQITFTLFGAGFNNNMGVKLKYGNTELLPFTIYIIDATTMTATFRIPQDVPTEKYDVVLYDTRNLPQEQLGVTYTEKSLVNITRPTPNMKLVTSLSTVNRSRHARLETLDLTIENKGNVDYNLNNMIVKLKTINWNGNEQDYDTINFNSPAAITPKSIVKVGEKIQKTTSIQMPQDNRISKVLVYVYENTIATNPVAKAEIELPNSYDPNEVQGPAGRGSSDKRYVIPGEWLHYTILFENKDTALAAANEVSINMILDPNFDLSTFTLGEVGFNRQIDSNLVDSSYGISIVDMLYPMDNHPMKVQTAVAFEPTSRTASWYLRSIDEAAKPMYNKFPDNPNLGFLPPNDSRIHNGEGFVSFKIKVRDDAPVGAIARVSADIKFDVNDIIVTDPDWFNTVTKPFALIIEHGEDSTKSYNVIGEQIDISTPTMVNGKVFSHWSFNYGSLINPKASTTVFIMPEQDAYVKAVYIAGKTIEMPTIYGSYTYTGDIITPKISFTNYSGNYTAIGLDSMAKNDAKVKITIEGNYVFENNSQTIEIPFTIQKAIGTLQAVATPSVIEIGSNVKSKLDSIISGIRAQDATGLTLSINSTKIDYAKSGTYPAEISYSWNNKDSINYMINTINAMVTIIDSARSDNKIALKSQKGIFADIKEGFTDRIYIQAPKSSNFITLKFSGLKYGSDFIINGASPNGTSVVISINKLRQGIEVVILNNGVKNKKRSLKVSLSGAPKGFTIDAPKFLKYDIAEETDPNTVYDIVTEIVTDISKFSDIKISSLKNQSNDLYGRSGTVVDSYYVPTTLESAPLGWLDILTDEDGNMIRAYNAPLKIAPKLEINISIDSVYELKKSGLTSFKKKPALKTVTYDPYGKRTMKKAAVSLVQFNLKSNPTVAKAMFKPNVKMYDARAIKLSRAENINSYGKNMLDQVGAQLVLTYSDKTDSIQVKEAPIGAIASHAPAKLVWVDTQMERNTTVITIKGNFLGASPKAFFEYSTGTAIKTVSCSIVKQDKNDPMVFKDGNWTQLRIKMPKRPRQAKDSFRLVIDNGIGYGIVESITDIPNITPPNN